ncbi:MAG: phosphoethanolamine transferase [Desulfovibrionales bacterium]|nr:phosphoethanolamine transferase [Desulfovibrionales bacterium]
MVHIPKLHIRSLALILALIFTGLAAGSISSLSLLPAILVSCYIAAFTFSVCYAALYFKRIAALLIPLLLSLSCVAAYFKTFLHLRITDELLFLVLETTIGETREFVTTNLAVGISASIFVGILCSLIIWKSHGKPNLKLLLPLLVLSIGINIGLSKLKKHPQVIEYYSVASTKYMYPFGVINTLVNFSGRYVNFVLAPPPTSSATLAAKYTPEPDGESVKVIFVIGESARADHFQINGYERETTPNLMKEKNLISYIKQRSFAAHTRKSVPAMITPATTDNPEITTSSFMPLFEKYGFKTAWLSANSRYVDASDAPTTRAMGHVQKTVFRNDFTTADYTEFKDEMMLPEVKKLLEPGNQALVIHTRGSHPLYYTKYTDEYRKYTPDVFEEYNDIETVVNSYDNSILATDAFLKRIFDLVRDENAIVIYSSDHGQSLGENGIFLHGNEFVPGQREVPFVIWYSDKYKQYHPDRIAALEALNQRTDLTHDVLFPWTLQLGGITLVNSALPLLSIS